MSLDFASTPLLLSGSGAIYRIQALLNTWNVISVATPTHVWQMDTRKKHACKLLKSLTVDLKPAWSMLFIYNSVTTVFSLIVINNKILHVCQL